MLTCLRFSFGVLIVGVVIVSASIPLVRLLFFPILATKNQHGDYDADGQNHGNIYGLLLV